jgi:hypothetical protein
MPSDPDSVPAQAAKPAKSSAKGRRGGGDAEPSMPGQAE